eukprot:scaffold101509_cov35-Attheya_sp.AAC.1
MDMIKDFKNPLDIEPEEEIENQDVETQTGKLVEKTMLLHKRSNQIIVMTKFTTPRNGVRAQLLMTTVRPAVTAAAATARPVLLLVPQLRNFVTSKN